MTGNEFEELFGSCLRESGPAYVAAREKLLRRPDDPVVRALLRDRAAGDDPEAATTAEILLGWLMDGHRYALAASIMRDRSGATVGMTPAPGRLALELTALGRSVVPRLVEMLTKSREFPSPTDTRIILQALIELRDPSSIGPLLRYFGTVRDDTVRVPVLTALGSLGDTEDQEVTAIALRLLDDEGQSLAMRGTAALCLGSLGRKEAAGSLVRLVQSPEPELRGSSVRALKYLWQEESRSVTGRARTGRAARTDAAGPPVRTDLAGAGDGDGVGPLRDVLDQEGDEQVALEMVGAMTVLAQYPPPGAPPTTADEALDALDHAMTRHRHPSVRHAAKKAHDRITEGGRW